MNREELQQYRTALNMNLGQLDVDYLQHRVLLILSRITSNELIFKGGTALSKTFGLGRFSEDLDFTALKKIDIKNISGSIISELKVMGFAAEIKSIEENSISYSVRLRIHGVTYDGSEQSKISIRLEISKREKIYLHPKLAEITPIYQDVPPYTLYIMNEEEILAEKIRAIFTRNKARDVYDLNFLLSKAVPINKEVIQKKLDYYKIKFSLRELKKKVHEYGKIWEKELRYLVSNVPDFNKVEKNIIDAFEGGI